jgi:hypothetical protein
VLEAGTERVSCATVWLGAFSQMPTADFHKHFDTGVRNSIAEAVAMTTEVRNPVAQPAELRSVELEA